MGRRKSYDEAFYRGQSSGSRSSALAILPHVIQLVSPASAVDVGCGVGTWLGACLELGIGRVLGVDGEYVDRAQLQIPGECFAPRDLSRPLEVEQHFDLAISLEVAEHLPQARASAFVEDLTRLAPVVLFSAAVPFQGGVSHVNEQWPEYWAGLFARRDYLPVDCIRSRHWNDQRVEWWYAQNTFLYVAKAHLAVSAKLREAIPSAPLPMSVVHPRLYESVADHARLPLRTQLGWLRRSAMTRLGLTRPR